MANVDLGMVAEQLFVDFMAPLVLGGEMRPARPIGGNVAFSLGIERSVADSDRHAQVQLARVRLARRLLPIDRLPDATPDEWALAACLHDLVQSTHHGLDGLFRGRATDKLRTIAIETIKRIPKPRTVAEVLSRHTWFARMFEIARLDTTVSWWVGSRSFFGETPPERLMTWPDLRRVKVSKVQNFLPDLPLHGDDEKGAQRTAFSYALTLFLHQTPLTDLGTLDRAEPPFAWGRETLALAATRMGRTLIARTLRALPESVVNAALGRSTRALLAGQAGQATRLAMALLGDLALSSAQGAVLRGEAAPPVSSLDDLEASFARTAGAIAAREQLGREGRAIPSTERAALAAYLQPLCEGPLGRDLSATLATLKP